MRTLGPPRPNPQIMHKRSFFRLGILSGGGRHIGMATSALPSFKFPFRSSRLFNFAISSSSHALPSLISSINLNARKRYLPGASSEGIPAELAEDPKFVPLNADEPIYGPPALLLEGFEASEMEKIQILLEDLDGEFMKIIYCTEDMLNKSVWDAMHSEQISLEDVKIAQSLPRLCIMSGLSGEEMIMFIDAFPETGLQPAVFAALVPNSAVKLLWEVIEEIMGDHEMMSEKQSSGDALPVQALNPGTNKGRVCSENRFLELLFS